MFITTNYLQDSDGHIQDSAHLCALHLAQPLQLKWY